MLYLHHWLNIAGLSLDFVGVLLLSYEWWIALKADEREMAIAQQERQMQRLREMRPETNPGFSQIDRLKDQMRFNDQIQRTRTALGMRRGWFAVALVMISGGFLLQILGSLPDI